MKPFYWLIHKLLRFHFSLFHKYQVYGVEHIPKGSCIIAPNHASYYDPPLVSASYHDEVYFLARGSLFHVKLFKILITRLNAFPVSGTSQSLTSFKLIFQLINEQKKVVVFPEGQRTFDGHLAPIKSGIGMLALKCHCPIIPTYLHGTFEVWPRQQTFPKLTGKLATVFGSPIEIESFSDLSKKEAQEKIAQQVESAILNLRKWYLDGCKGTPP